MRLIEHFFTITSPRYLLSTTYPLFRFSYRYSSSTAATARFIIVRLATCGELTARRLSPAALRSRPITMSSAKRKTDAGALSAGDSNANKKPKVNSSITSFFGAPKPSTTSNSTSTGTTPTSSATAPAAPAIKFDKDKWVASLTPEQRQFLSLEIETLDPSWLAVLRDEIVTPQFLELKKFLDREAGQGKKIFPPREDIYSWYAAPSFPNVYIPIASITP